MIWFFSMRGRIEYCELGNIIFVQCERNYEEREYEHHFQRILPKLLYHIEWYLRMNKSSLDGLPETEVTIAVTTKSEKCKEMMPFN